MKVEILAVTAKIQKAKNIYKLREKSSKRWRDVVMVGETTGNVWQSVAKM